MAAHVPLLPGPRSIRLIRLASQGVIQFITLDLAACPEFYALSYTWGSPFPSTVPWTDTTESMRTVWGEPIHIRLNLWLALKSIAADHNNIAEQWLWVDALCINQDNLSERASQVALMPLIYRKASKVVVWMGPSNAESYRFARTLNSFHTLFALYKSSAISVKDLSEYNQSPVTFTAKYGISLDAEDWSCIIAFFSRSWFYRRWTWPETALAARVDVICGGQVIQWQDMLNFEEIYRLGRWGLILGRPNVLKKSKSPIQALRPRVFIENVARVSGGYERFRKAVITNYGRWVPSAVILELLCQSVELETSDPHDIIYATACLVCYIVSLGDQKNSFERLYDVTKANADYHITVPELFFDFTCRSIRHLRDPSVFAIVQPNLWSAGRQSCSWVPDLNDLSLCMSQQNIAFRGIYTTAFGNMSHETQVIPQRHVTGRSLSLNGFSIGRIKQLETINQPGYQFETLRQIMAFCEELPTEVRKLHGPPQPTFDALWQTLIGGLNGEDDTTGKMGLAFADFVLHILAHSCLKFGSDEAAQMRLKSLCDSIQRQAAASPSKQIDDVYKAVLMLCPNSRLSEEANLSRLSYACHITKPRRSTVGRARVLCQDLLPGSIWRRAFQSASPAILKYLLRNILEFDRLDAFWQALKQTGPRTLFQTEKDSIGMCPALPPDLCTSELEVWALEGGRVPYVLQRVASDKWRLLGPCYVHGAMNLNLSLEKNTTSWETLVLI